MLIKERMWMSPMGSGSGYDWAALESILDGEQEASPKFTNQHESGYWGDGTAAHFWGSTEAPVRRPVAAVVDGMRQSWKAVTAETIRQKAVDYKRTLYAKKMGRASWPTSKPLPLDDERLLGTKKPRKSEDRVVACQAPVKGLYAAPLTGDQTHTVLEAVQEDLKAALGGRVSITGLTATKKGTVLDFYVVTSSKTASATFDTCKKALTVKPLALAKALAAYKRLGVRPSTTFAVDASRAVVVYKARGGVRCDPREGRDAGDLGMTEVLQRSSFVVKGGIQNFRKAQEQRTSNFAGVSPSASPTTSPTTRRPASGTSPSSSRGGYSSSKPGTRPTTRGSPASPGSSPSSSPSGTPTTAKDRKKALLGRVLKKTTQEMAKIEQDVPQVASSYALQQRKEAVTQANVELARERGNALESEITMAKNMLKPPCEWRGAIVKQEGNRKQFENFEVHVVDFNRQTRMMVGRAHIQNGKMDTTYQCKVRVLVKDAQLTIELVLDNGGVFKGKLEKKGVFSGTYKQPNGSGTFKLMRYEESDK